MESEYAAENISTKQPTPREKARFQGEDGDKEWSRRPETTQGKGPQAPDRSALLGFSLPKEARLRKRAEFLAVYEKGKRFEGRFITVFILPNSGHLNRLGATATKKAIGTKAHDRNRAKRLIREAFRLSRNEIDAVGVSFDWVLNAKRSILTKKVADVISDLGQIALRVRIASGNGQNDGATRTNE